MHILFALAGLLAITSPASAQRLPDTVVPEHYTLAFTPDLATATFGGRATITVQLAAASREVVLNAAELAFDSVRITAAGQTQDARVTLDAERETATLLVPRAIPRGQATIDIAYRGVLNDKLRGFYLSQANGRRYAVTQLEATDARRAFPAFDEPVFKATFDISLTVATGDSAISNGRLLRDEPGPAPGTHTLTFARTARMSAYLVAMVVGDFTCRDGRVGAVPIRVCSTPDKVPLTAFALEAAERSFAFFERYLEVPYPFGKLDIVAVPDFSAGAMENTGAIFFRESTLLADPTRASLATRKNIANVVAHEIAHHWFGDLVTMRWWDDIWLNESFATWAANKPVAEWKPEWRVDVDVVDEMLAAKAADGAGTTRAVRMDVESPEQINQVFDAIAYEKGASVLRMVESYVGAESFRRGMSAYVRTFSYRNATAEDFWNEMTRVTGKPVNQIMQSFIDQPGVPLVTVQTQCVSGQGRVTLTQGRYSPTSASPRPQSWSIPVCLSRGTGAPQCELLSQPTQTFTVPSCAPAVLANAGAVGYFVAEHDSNTVLARARDTGDAALGSGEKLVLLDDEWWLLRAGRRDIGAFLDVLSAVATDETSLVTEQVNGRLADVADALQGAPAERFAAWVRTRFAADLERVGFPGQAADDDEVQNRRRALLAIVAGVGQEPAARARVRDAVTGYLAEPDSLSGTLVPQALLIAAADGDTALYERVLRELTRPGVSPADRNNFLRALGGFDDPALVDRTMRLALSPDVRSQDMRVLVPQVIGGPAGERAWEFIKREWTQFSQKADPFQGLPGVIRALGSMCTAERAADVRAFFAANPVPSAERSIRQALERIDTCVAFRATHTGPLVEWLDRQR